MFDRVLRSADGNQVLANGKWVLADGDQGLAIDNWCVDQSADQVLADGIQV